MMHAAVAEWVSIHAPEHPGDVVDVGGRDINGTVRSIFGHAQSYLSVDPVDGPGVDVALPFEEWDGEADTVLCCEVAEHVERWDLIVCHAFDVLRPGGTFIFTAAGPGRGRHSAIDEAPIRPWEHYENVDPDVLCNVLTAAGFSGVVVDVAGTDVRAVAVKES
jgi:SAM-dependent methyltransferase